MPEIISMKRFTGIAGQFGYNVKVQYPNEAIQTVGFVSSTFGGGIYQITPTFGQIRVTSPERFGPVLNPEWIRQYFKD